MLAQKDNIRASLLQTPRDENEDQSKNKSIKAPKIKLNKFKAQTAMILETKLAKEMRVREIFIPPTKWNKFKLFIYNFYETFLIILALALSIYQDDASSFFFQIIALVLLHYSKRDFGAYVPLQLKICIGTISFWTFFAIFKYIYMVQIEPTLTQTFSERKVDLQALGYNFKDPQPDGTILFDYWPSLEFETLAIILVGLLINYYNGQIDHALREQPYRYIHHSEWLSMHSVLYNLFFITLITDTFFQQTLIQMIVLGLMMFIMILWALQTNRRETITKVGVSICNWLLIFQLAMLAFTQISYVINWIKEYQALYDFMFYAGLILNQEPVLFAVIHIFMICFIIGFGSTLSTTYFNYVFYKEHEKEFAPPALHETLLRKASLEGKKARGDSLKKGQDEDEEPVLKKRNRFSFANIHQKLTKFDYEKFVRTYLPYLCIWIIRIISIIYSYAYHGYPAFIILTWVLASFMMPLSPFVNCTTYFYLPIFMIGFFFTYFINIPGIFLIYQNGQQIFIHPEIFQSLGRPFKYAPIEVGGMVINLLFLILLMGSKGELKLQRDEFRIGIFEKLTDKQSLFLWQLSFYIFKRLHIVLLSLIFIFGMRELNIYYIGLMYFFVAYVSSLASYRKSGIVLLLWASFFIWLQYFWSLIQNNFDQSSIISKIFMMMTFQKYTESNQTLGGLNNYLEYDIPFGQWAIFMLQVVMYTTNRMFLPGRVHRAKSLENPTVNKDYPSMSDYYEEKCDFVLRRKFPACARILIRLRMIFSEMMIIGILITQGFILVLQPPNLMFWGFLIFSLTLQTAVVSASEEDPNMLRRCSNQSKILKYYSGFVLIAQIAYHFINDKAFLAQYGFDEILNYILGDLNEYMTIIGFENYQNSTRSVFAIFVSQILFYITACILEDYFIEKLEELEAKRNMIFIASMHRLEQTQHDYIPQQSFIPTGEDASNQRLPIETQKSFVGSASAIQAKLQNQEEDEFFKQNEKERVIFDYERIRFSIPYMIYQRINQWRIMDTVAMNSHLLTALITIVLCTNWQISLFMAFYLLCVVVLCIRAAKDLYHNGQRMRNYSTEMDVNTAHRLNKEYMHEASKTLLKVRTEQWSKQYWLLIISMIIMYPTPILTTLMTRMTPEQVAVSQTSIFWLFWTGVYLSPEDVNSLSNHAPLYAMLILLIFEKQQQRWQQNRYGCTLEKVNEFKTLEEQMKKIQEEKDVQPINKVSEIEKPTPLSEFITIMEAKQECARVESLFREQTDEVKEKRLLEKIELGLKRKYVIKIRNALKLVMEQISLQLLLLSCANKSNIVSILYLGLLLTFLLIKNKTTGMLYMSYCFGITLALEYLISLTNLTSLNNPMKFPAPYNEGYPSKVNPNGEFIFPWFLKIDFLRNNLHWANFLSIDIQGAQVNDIWFDFANLVILTIYFFNFGNPINANNIKVSFSQTRELEDSLQEYSRMQVRKKYNLKFPPKLENSNSFFDKADGELQQKSTNPANKAELRQFKKEQREQEDLQAQQAADDSLEYFLGATHYLNEIKKNIFAYYFSKKARYFSFIGLQVITLIMTLMLAMLCRSLMSFGYMIFSVPLIMQITDFFQLDQIQQEGRRWKHPYYICGPLMIFCFVDIAIQILCQTPFYGGDWLIRQFGFDKVYDINTNITFVDMLYAGEEGYRFVSLADGGRNLLFLILKSLNLFFIFLQSRIYQSDAFWEFIRVDLRRLLKLAQSFKSQAMTYRYNNWKLQKIVTVQQRKQKMYEGVAELRMKMNHYLKSQQSLITGKALINTPAPSKNNLRQPLLEKIDEEEQKIDTTTTIISPNQRTESPNELAEKVSSSIQTALRRKSNLLNKPISQKKLELSKNLESNFKFQQFQDLLRQDDDYFEKEELLQKMTKQVGRCGSCYLRLKKRYVNQIVFVNDIEAAKNIKQLMSQGKRKIESDLEREMKHDIDVIFQQKRNSMSFDKKIRKKAGVKVVDPEDEITIQQMPRTLDFLKFSNIFLANCGAILQAIFSNLAPIAYIFMIVSQILNAGLVSILLPFAVFGYALMEEGRPGKDFWRILKIYVIAILFLKFIINLDLLYDNQALVDTYVSISNYMLFGLWREDTTWGLFLYILPELVILSCILGQNYYEILVGLYEKREIDIENIEEARERFLKQFKEDQQEVDDKMLKLDRARKIIEEDDVDRFEDPVESYNERIAKYPKKIRKIIDQVEAKMKKEHDDVINDNNQLQKMRKELAEDITQGLKDDPITRRYSLIPERQERKKLVKELKAKRLENQGLVRNYFGKHSYFRRLFPKVKEQKPGIDFYGRITFIQFVICVFLISNYTKLDARGTQNLENSSQFSIYMVVMLFVQVFVMILERYISRTNTRVNLQKARNGRKELTDEIQSKYTLGENRSLSMHLQAQKTSDTILFGKDAKGNNVETSKEILSIELQHTRMTNQQVSKWCIQWILLILYHVLVFWIFPLSSNDAIYGTPYCDTSNKNLYEKYGCLSFKQNIYLILFYMIFCYYFMLSALQIRYGYPDYKEPSSLTSKLGLGPVLTYRIFYMLPFVFELKIILDWCFQKTSLDIFQWLELGEIDSELFFFKNGNKGYFERKLGTRIVRFEKCLCGCFCLGLILFFLIGPFFMFSNLSYIADTNLVTDALVDFSINIQDVDKYETYEYPIFNTDSPLSMQVMSEDEFNYRGYSKLPETKFFEPDQVQRVVMKNSSDSEWTVSGDYRASFRDLLQDQVQNSTNLVTTLVLTYSFTRPGPAEAPVATDTFEMTLNSFIPDQKQTIEELHEAMQIDCVQNPEDIRNVHIKNFLPNQVRLGEQKGIIDLGLPRENVTLSYSCENYWALSVNFSGIMFITFSDLISSNFFDATSIMGFYIGVALIVGQTLRKIVVYNADRIYITEIPNPDPIRNLIRCIYMQRLEQNLKKEEELFFILMEILRSPEMIRAICGSSLRAPLALTVARVESQSTLNQSNSINRV